MLDLNQLEDILRLPESHDLDFKGAEYDLTSSGGKNGKGRLNLIKDLLCMSNTPREGSAYIITGVINEPGSENRVAGIQKNIDDSTIQQLVTSWLKPAPSVSYYEIKIDGQYVGVFEILPARQLGPFYVSGALKQSKRRMIEQGDFLNQDLIYYRRGTTNAEAGEVEKRAILNWFNAHRNDRWHDWEALLLTCDDFEDRRHYVLFTSSLSHFDQADLEPLSNISWSAIIDFDPASDQTGLLNAFQNSQYQRNIIRAVRGEFPSFSGWQDTYWFFAKGLIGRQDTLLRRQDWKAWQTLYGSELNDQFIHIAKTLLPNAVTFVVAWSDDQLLKHLQSTIDATAGFDNSKYVIVSESTTAIENRIDEEFEAKLFDIPIEHLASGISVKFPRNVSEGTNYTLPSEHGTPIPIPTDRRTWLQSQLSLVHLGLPIKEPQIGNADGPASEFYRGGVISWEDLDLRRDLERDLTSKVERRVRYDLSSRATDIISVIHRPGAGGSTIARRVVWDLHREYPSVVLHGGDPEGIVERIEYIAHNTRLPVLALVDSAEIAERGIENIYNLLRSRNTGCLLLSVSRRHQLHKPAVRSFPLDIKLTNSELHRFYEKFVSLVPNRRLELKTILNSSIREEQTLFQFGLTAYGQDYKGLFDYVSHRIKGLTEVQLKLLVYLGISFKYAQRGLPAQSFQYLLGLSQRDVLLERVFDGQQSVLDILINEKNDWRPIHQIVAEEILIQLLTPPDGERRNWKQQLSAHGKSFVEFCADGWLITSESTLELLRRVFIYRDTADVLGREPGDDTNRISSKLSTFATFIADIPSPEGRLEMLKYLADSLPEEAHFWAHLGRFQASIMQNFPASLEAVDRAIQLQPNDHVLWHMKGMSFRYQAQHLMSAREDISDIVKLAEQASECFEESRRCNPDHEHAYTSEVQLLAKVLNYAVRDSKKSIFQYIRENHRIPYIGEAIDKAESLLAVVRSNREGTGSSSWEQSCRADITHLYGNYREALEIWDSLLTRQDVYHPPVRRQIVYALMDREKHWNKMPQSSLDRCIRLLQDNLDEQLSSDRDLRLWLQAVRYASIVPSIESIIEKVSYWKANTGALDAMYYLYVLYSLQALEGLTIELDLATRFLQESRNESRNRRNRLKSFEWLGQGEGIGKLVHQSTLGDWGRDLNFWTNTSSLARVEGVISHVRGPEGGRIHLNGLSCFFVPGARRDNPISRDSVNRRVNFFLGFSYSDMRAWDVKYSD